ncbi:MAG: TonB-dependent siderophore receptor [Cellvibrionaceae bacterium]
MPLTKLPIAVSALFLMLATHGSYADDSKGETTRSDSSSTTLSPVVVDGSHEAYKGDFVPLETPQSELVIDNEVLSDSGAVDLNQALDLSASVARQNNFGGLWNSFALRGFVGDENLPSNYLVNGFNAGRGFGGPRDLSGIESVEVLKGPRAALFGRGEPGGTVNLVTKRPTFKEEGEIKLTAGSFDTYRSDLDWTSPLSDSVAVRIVGFYEDAESFRDTVETTKQGLNPSITWFVNDQSEFNYELEYSEQEIPFDRGVIAIDGELGLIPESRFLGEPDYGPIETEVLGHQLEFRRELNDDWSMLVGYNYRDTSLEGLASENGFGDPDADGNFDRFSRYRDYNATYQVLRAELSGSFDTAGLAHRIIVGIDVDEFENDQVATRDRTTDQSINIFNPVYGNYPESSLNLVPQIDRVETQESAGFYIQDQISVTEKFDIRVGARYDDYKQELNNRLASSTSKQTESEFSPQLGFVYQFNDAASFYAAYGENFRPLSGVNGVTGEGFEPNNSTSIEAGVKFELNGGRLVGNIAIFKVEQENIPGVNNSTDFDAVAIGEAESQGVEIDLNGEITDGLKLWLSYAYVDAKTKNDFVDPNFGFTLSAGSPLLNIPKNQLNIQLVKQTKLFGQRFDFGAGVLYVDKRNGFFGADFELPSYTTTRLFASYDMTKDITLRLDVDNVFDEEYYVNSFADTWVQAGAPLNARLSVAFRL